MSQAPISSIVYPSLKFPSSTSSHLPTIHRPPPALLPLDLIPDFRPEQAFLKSIKPFLNPISHAQADNEPNPLKTIDWLDESLEIDWTGIFWLTLKAQVTQPYLVGISTYFAIILYREFAVLARASVSKAVEGLGGMFRSVSASASARS
ncbi:hypothetical protein BDY24DRAFT_417681 [Mrakia frigida]|uniref:uncharacterized protein n=1 Tax=Mrakia frigida TaxID=29902 RepID=UPI003FCC088C